MMIIPFPVGMPDERLLTHRLKSTSIAGVTGGLVAVGLWAYQHFVHHVWRWDLFAVAATIAAVKVAAMVWYRLTD